MQLNKRNIIAENAVGLCLLHTNRHDKTGRFLLVGVSVSSRRLVCGVSKTSFGSLAIAFFGHQTCLVLSSFIMSVSVWRSFE